MQYIKEGMKEYLISESRNQYFMDIEYHILCHNQPDCLCPVHIRDVDGQSRILFDVTSLECIKENGKWRCLSRKELISFLESMKELIRVMDRLLLDISQISFDPCQIFREKTGGFRWIYTPEKKKEIAADIEQLFRWILTVIDYDDIGIIQFAYHAYWNIRNHPVSEEILQDCIDYLPEEAEKYEKTSYDDYFPTEARSQFSSGGSQNFYQPEENKYKEDIYRKDALRKSVYDSDFFSGDDFGKDIFSDDISGKQGRDSIDGKVFKLKIFELLSAVLSAVFALAFIIFFSIGLKQNMVRELKYILMTITGLMFLFFYTALAMHKKRVRMINQQEGEKNSHREIPSPSYDYSWEEEGGTTVLGIRKNMLLPALKSTDDGRVYVIDEFPYYIGSESGMNQLTINEPSVSRRHAAIIRGKQTGQYDLQDLRSTNGTWIDQQELTYEKPVRLEPGERVRFAEKSFEFIMLDSPHKII